MAISKEQLIIELKTKGISLTKGQLNQLDKSVQGASRSVLSMGTALKLMSGVLAVTTVGALIKATQAGKAFEQSMADVKAISGATAQEFKALENNAKNLGRTTKFTASEVAGLQKEYSKLGFTASEINNVTKGTLALSAATGEDLANSASVAGTTLRGFGLDVSNTGRVTDVMAKSFTSSALDMQKFTDSMKYVAPIAKMAGVNLEGTTAILGQLANAGIDGSMAGTSLRRILLEAGREGSKLADRMGGPIKSFEDFQVKLKKLRDEGFDPLVEGADMVGQRAVTAFGIMLEGVGSIDTLNESLERASGSAQRMADIQLDTLQGKMTIMKSATEGLAIALFGRLAPGLKESVTQMTSMIGALTRFVEIPASQALNEESIALNSVVRALEANWQNQEIRNRLISELQSQYGDYLGDLDLEKSSLEEIKDTIRAVNDATETRIKLLVNEERLAEAYEAQQSAIKKLVTATKLYEEAKIKEEDYLVVGNLASAVDRWRKRVDDTTEAYKQLRQEFFVPPDTPSPLIGDQSPSPLLTDEERARMAPQNRSKPSDGGGGRGSSGPSKSQIENAKEGLKTFFKELEMVDMTEQEKQLTREFEHTEKMFSLAKATEEQKLAMKNHFIERAKKLDEDQKAQELHSTIKQYSFLAKSQGAFLKQFAGSQKVAARMDQASAIADTYSAAMKAFKAGGGFPTGIPPALASISFGLAQVAQISKQIGEFKFAATGMDEIVNKPTLIMAGEAGPESVQITPLDASMNQNGPQGGSVVVNVSGNLLSSEYVEDVLADEIKSAIRRGADFGTA